MSTSQTLFALNIVKVVIFLREIVGGKPLPLLVVFCVHVIAKTGVAVRSQPAYVGRKSWHFYCENVGDNDG